MVSVYIKITTLSERKPNTFYWWLVWFGFTVSSCFWKFVCFIIICHLFNGFYSTLWMCVEWEKVQISDYIYLIILMLTRTRVTIWCTHTHMDTHLFFDRFCRRCNSMKDYFHFFHLSLSLAIPHTRCDCNNNKIKLANQMVLKWS